MWEKLKNNERISLSKLVLFLVSQKNPENFRVSWNIIDNIIGCYPLNMMEKVSESLYNNDTIFTIWERK